MGTTLAGRFIVRAHLGSGAFGTVYAAVDTHHQTGVALKVLTRVSGSTIYRFKQEFRALSDLHHPNLVRLYQLFSEGSEWFFSMELLAGRRFDDFARGEGVYEAPSDSTVSEGEVAVEPRYGAPRADVARLRRGLAQLVAGVQALHSNGVLHRDLKPANVLVTAEERVVLLDFGLATGADADAQESVLGLLMGTPTYMAPEQSMGLAISEAADWYALGVMLFEVLFGRLPLSGTVQDILAAKLAVDLWDWSGAPPDADDLVELCRALLRPTASDRPDAATIAAAVGAASPAPVSPSRVSAHFLGRSEELAALQGALRTVATTGPVVVQLRGPSGVGKSALVREFLQTLGSDAVVLQGRCYDRESVPYKALDGVVDALTRHLRRLSPEQAGLLLPRQSRALCRLFPVFGRLELVADQPERSQHASPHEERRRGFGALREILARLGDRRPLVVSIDDLQWGDADSLAPLSELLAPPDPPRLLLILTYRSEDADTSPVLQMLGTTEYLVSLGEVRTLDLRPLSMEQSETLARALLSGDHVDHASHLARESGGSPFLITELVRAHDGGLVGSGTFSLGAVMQARVERLSDAARRLLRVVAVAGRPLPREVAYRAAGLDGAISEPATEELLRERLVRHAVAEDSFLETFHDRIRETVVEALPEGEVKEHHGSVAAAFEVAGISDPEAIAEHYRLAGEPDLARPAAVAAARRAADAFAFDRAAELFENARLGAPSEERRLLTSELARTLVYAGRGRAAAEAYLQAMLVAAPQEEPELLRLATEQLLRCGAIDEGLALARQLLANSGLSYHESRFGALLSVVWQRLVLAVRRFGFVERELGPNDADAVVRADLCWTLGSCLLPLDIIRSAEYQMRHTRYALALGDPYRVARGLALEGMLRAAEGSRLGEALATQGKELGTRIDHPHAMVWGNASLAIADFCAGRWRRSVERAQHTLELLIARNPESVFERALLEIWFKNRAHFFLGDLETFVKEALATDERAQGREAHLTLMTSRSVGITHVMLLRGQPEEARRLSAEGLEAWDAGGEWRFQHQENLKAQVTCDLYEGRPEQALERVEATWKQQSRAMVHRIENERIQSFSLFALAALYARDLGRFNHWHRKLSAVNNPWAAGLSTALRAGRLALDDPEAAMGAYERAAVQFEGLEMPLYALAARRRRALLLGGERGTEIIAEADAVLAGKGVAEPERWVRILVG